MKSEEILQEKTVSGKGLPKLSVEQEQLGHRVYVVGFNGWRLENVFSLETPQLVGKGTFSLSLKRPQSFVIYIP